MKTRRETPREKDACLEQYCYEFLTRAGRKIFLICETSSWLKGHSHLMNQCWEDYIFIGLYLIRNLSICRGRKKKKRVGLLCV